MSIEDVFREVDEELRADKMRRLWGRVAPFVLGGAVAIVLATIGWTVWRNQELEKRLTEATRFAAAQAAAERGDAAQAGAELKLLAGESGATYAMFARFAAAGLALKQGDEAAALALFDALAADASLAPEWRDLAVLRGALRRVDSEDRAAFDARIAPLLAVSSPWRHSARELQALAAIRAGDLAAAKTALQLVSDDLNAPPGLRARATELLNGLGG